MAKTKKKNRKPIYIFLAALVLLYLIIYIIPGVTGFLKPTEILKPGTVQVREPVTCYFVRDEQVYEAGRAGKIQYLIDEGIRVRRGMRVLKLTAAPAASGQTQPSGKNDRFSGMMDLLKNSAIPVTNGRAGSSGILSYYLDGYESYFTPSDMKRLSRERVEKLGITAVNTKRGSTLAGQPLFKICDNNNWYLLCWVGQDSVSKYQEGQPVTIQLPGGNVTAAVDSITQDGSFWRIIFQSNWYYPYFAKSRRVEAQVVSENCSGLIASNSSLTTRGGQPGVMVKQVDGSYLFKRVMVIGTDGTRSALQDASFTDQKGNIVQTVNVYDEILKHPAKGN